MARNMRATWLEVYKNHDDGEWKIANGRTGQVLATADTKAQAKMMTPSYLGSGGKYLYLGAQYYKTDGTRGQRQTDPEALKDWTRSKSSPSRH